MSKVTIRDVAREAGVSVATASNALNNPAIVRPETRELVEKAAEQLNYVPNINGKRLRSKETKTMGLFISSMTGEYYSALQQSMFHTCTRLGYEMLVYPVSSVRFIQQKLNGNMLDGAVVFCDEIDDELARQMISGDFPLVFLGREAAGMHVSSILLESFDHGRMAADYLLGLGKRHLMHIFGFHGNLDSEQRWKGFQEGIRQKGLQPDEIELIEGRFERAAAYRRMRKYLIEGKPVPDAIFCANDLSAIGCMAALSERGLRIPEDVSVLGCDDITLCEYIRPGLTTIRTNFWDTGSLAAEELLRLIRGEQGRILRQSGTLVIRHSCARTVRGEDEDE